MKIKKIYFILIAIMLLVFSSISAYAESEIKPKMSKEAVERIIKDNLNNYFNMQISDKNLKDNLEFEEEGMSEKPVWSLWYKSNSRTRVNLEIDDATGKLVYFDKHKMGTNYEELKGNKNIADAKITTEEAKKIANELLKKINPNEVNSVKLSNIEDYYYTYRQIVNGIEYKENKINIEVDKETGKILEYSIDWDNNLKFEDTKNIISKDKALELFKNNAIVDMAYKSSYFEDENKLEKANLIYNINCNLIDAKNGTFIDYEGMPVKEAKYKDISKEEKEQILATSNKNNSNSPMSKDEATSFMKEQLKELLSCDFELSEVGYAKENKEEIRGEFIEKNSDVTGDIRINSKTKNITYFERYFEEEELEKQEKIKANITWEQGYDKALNIIKKYYPDKMMNIDTKLEHIQGENQQQYHYNFYRLENGVAYDYNNVSVDIDTETGKINSINFDWTDNVSFSDKDKVMDIQKAKEIFFNNYKVNLSYEKVEYEKGKEKAIVVYELIPTKEQYDHLDAITGKFLDIDGEEVK